MAYTKVQVEALNNAQLASGQTDKITATKHRLVNQAIIDEMYDAQSRANLLAAVEAALSTATGDKVLLIRSGVAKLVDISLIASDTLFLGLYASLVALETAHATAESGQYAIVDPGSGTDAVKYIWDEDEGWVSGGGTGASVWGDLGGTLADQTDLNSALNARELITNKATDFTTIDDTKYPTTEAVVEKLSARETKTDNFATVQADNQKFIVCNSAITKTVTVDQLTTDSYVTLVNINVGQWNLVAGTGVTLHGSSSFLAGGEVNSITLWWITATDVYVISGSSTSLNALQINGILAVRAGLSAGVIAKVGGVIHTNITTTGNVGGGEDDLFLYELPSNILAADKASIHTIASGTFAANANNKRLRVKFGGTNIFDSTALALNAGDWRLDIQVFRTSSATQKAVVLITTSNSTLYTSTDYATAAIDLTAPVELRITAEATSNNDVVGEVFKVSYQPAE